LEPGEKKDIRSKIYAARGGDSEALLRRYRLDFPEYR
jgi:hypothetical protein